jgi:hypothetical protein
VARVCALLNAAEARYVIVGATAMQLWGTSRATRDMAMLIEPTLGNATRVLDALARLPFAVDAELTTDAILQRGVTMIDDIPSVAVLTRAWNVQWPEASQAIAVFEVDGVPIPTASLETLMASKRTGRPQDTADILVLEAMRQTRDRA